MTADEFASLAHRLTGTPVKDLTATDREALAQILTDPTRQLDRSQVNELLLIVNKDRIQRPFFDFFFGPACSVETLEACIQRFQRVAMLRYGNFIHAYRKLSPIRDAKEFYRELGSLVEKPADIEQRLHQRQPTLVEIKTIAREDTYLVGYLSPRQIIAEHERAEFLVSKADELAAREQPWNDLVRIASNAGAEAASLNAIISRFERRHGRDFVELRAFLAASLQRLRDQKERLTRVRADAEANGDIYLTWDHMDVYFATSMRKRSEYEDLHAFVTELMNHADIPKLNLRYFDPTQSFTAERVDKGLVESLMLRRAKCTVYSVQDVDTIGKDSELAATLAQGKPVIAYIPEIDIESRAAALALMDLASILERLKFVLFSDDAFESLTPQPDLDFVRTFDPFVKADELVIWRSIVDDEPVRDVKVKYQSELIRLCTIIAAGEKRVYDARFSTLKMKHPLGLQVHLDTGVANGLLIARSVADCAKLLAGVITNSLDLTVREEKTMWYLVERTTESVYRVVTKNRKLTNCFWNFYVP